MSFFSGYIMKQLNLETLQISELDRKWIAPLVVFGPYIMPEQAKLLTAPVELEKDNLIKRISRKITPTYIAASQFISPYVPAITEIGSKLITNIGEIAKVDPVMAVGTAAMYASAAVYPFLHDIVNHAVEEPSENDVKFRNTRPGQTLNVLGNVAGAGIGFAKPSIGIAIEAARAGIQGEDYRPGGAGLGVTARALLSSAACAPPPTQISIALSDTEYQQHIADISSDDGRVDFCALQGAIEMAESALYWAEIDYALANRPTTAGQAPGDRPVIPSPFFSNPMSNWNAAQQSQIETLQKQLLAYHRFGTENGVHSQDVGSQCISAVKKSAYSLIQEQDLDRAVTAGEMIGNLIPGVGTLLDIKDTVKIIQYTQANGIHPLYAGLGILMGVSILGDALALGKPVAKGLALAAPDLVGAIKIGDDYIMRQGENLVHYAKESGRWTPQGSTPYTNMDLVLDQFGLGQEAIAESVKVLEVGSGLGVGKIASGTNLASDISNKAGKVVVFAVDGGHAYRTYDVATIKKLFKNANPYAGFAIEDTITDLVESAKHMDWVRFINPWQPSGHLAYFNFDAMRKIVDSGTSVQGVFSINTIFDVLRFPGSDELKQYAYDIIKNSGELTSYIDDYAASIGKTADTLDNSNLTDFFKKSLTIPGGQKTTTLVEQMRYAIGQNQRNLEGIYQAAFPGRTVSLKQLPAEILKEISPHSYNLSKQRDQFYIAEVLAK